MIRMSFKRIQGNVKMSGQTIYKTIQDHFSVLSLPLLPAVEIGVVLIIYAAEVPLFIDGQNRGRWMACGG